MYGSLRGFTKFLFDSPTRDSTNSLNQLSTSQNDSRHSDKITTKIKLNFGQEIVSKVCTAEKAFVAYCEKSHNLFYIDEKLKPELILRRQLKGL